MTLKAPILFINHSTVLTFAVLGMFILSYKSHAQLKTERLSIFTKGMFFHKQTGNMSLTNGSASIEVPQNLLLGTLWLKTASGVTIRQVDFVPDTLKKQKAISNYEDLLIANINKKLTLTLTANGNNKPSTDDITGTVINYNRTTNLLTFKAEDKTYFLQLGQIYAIKGTDVTQTYAADSIINAARIRLDGASKNTNLSVISMQTGIQWFPSYQIQLLSETEARLSLNATIVNQALKIANTEVDLVVGTPKMAFGTQLDPLSDVNYQLPTPSYRYANVSAAPMMMMKSARGSAKDEEMSMDMATVDQNMETEVDAVADLFFYRTGKISINKGDRALIPLFSNLTPVTHVYTAEIPDWANYANNGNIPESQQHKYPVTHRIRFKNETKSMLASAPIFLTDATQQPVGQASMAQTSPNGLVSIEINNNANIEVRNTEEVIGKKEKARSFAQTMYDKASVKGKIVLYNTMAKDAIFELQKNVTGSVTSSEGGKPTLNASYQNVNDNTTVTYKLTLKPRQRVEYNYTYDVYIYASR